MIRRVGVVACTGLVCFAIALLVGYRAGAATNDTAAKNVGGWKPGSGWGWIWGKNDEVGALNAMTGNTVRSSMSLVKEGKVYDLGVTYSRNSFKWPGHSPAEVITYRGPEGEKRQLDHEFIKSSNGNRLGLGWHSCAVFINDNVGTQIDGLGHVTVGGDNHWYNGFREAEWGGNFGIRKCDATTIPPIVARGVLLDIAGLKNVDALPSRYEITPGDVDRAVAAEKIDLRPGDVVLIRTGTLRYWGKDGSDADRLRVHDSAGISLETAKYLVERFGTMLIGADTSGLELQPPLVDQGTFIPCHNYLLVEQGVHIGELHFLEDLARDKTYEFCYICSTAKIAGTTAGFALRPIAIR